jgi:hypothetical protein
MGVADRVVSRLLLLNHSKGFEMELEAFSVSSLKFHSSTSSIKSVPNKQCVTLYRSKNK